MLSLALPTVLAISSADARVGGGFSSGSRGSRTFSAPPSTNTAPSAAQPFNRTFSQPSSPGHAARRPRGGGFFNRPGGGMLGGLAAGFLGAGLLGMLFGGGLFSGIGGFSSIIGLLLQIVLIVFVVRMAMSWWQRRQMSQPAYAGPAGGLDGDGDQQPSNFGGMGFGFGSNSAPLQIEPADYEAFERLLVEMQAACSNEDVGRLRTLATPEMVSFFTQDMQQNRARGADQQGVRHQAAAGRPRRILARRRQRVRQRRDALLDGRQVRRHPVRPPGQPAAISRGGNRGLDLHAAARRQLDTLGDPADQLIVRIMK